MATTAMKPRLLPPIASLLVVAGVASAAELPLSLPDPDSPRDSRPVIREERSVLVDSSSERWALEWLSPPEPVCTPEEDPDGWMTCPCSGFAFGEQGHLALVRHRREQKDETLVLDSFFDAVVAKLGTAVLQRWPVRLGDSDVRSDADAARLVRSRPVVALMTLGDYDHDGHATEFTLKIGNVACGHDEAVVIGVSRQNPALHVFGTASHPTVPLVLQSEDWERLRRSIAGVTVVEWTCGDHGSEQQTEIRLVTRLDGIHAERLLYDCAGPQFKRGRLLSREDLH